MPQPLYISNDGKRVGTIAAMRAYEAETGAPLSSEQEDIIQGRAAAAEQEMQRLADKGRCPDCAENRPLIEAVKDAVISVSRIDPDSKNHAKQISEFWSAVDLEFRRIYGHPE